MWRLVKNPLRVGYPLEDGIGDVMAFRTATADTFLPRRSIGRSEKAVLMAAALACAVGAAGWLSQAPSSARQTSADILSFEDRFVPPTAFVSRYAHAALQPRDRAAESVLEAKLRDARVHLAEQLAWSDWRSSLQPEKQADITADTPPDIPLPRVRPSGADLQVAVDNSTPVPRTDDRTMLQKLSDLLPGKLRLASLTPGSGLFRSGPDLAALGYDSQTAIYDISAHAVYLPSGLKLEAHSGMGRLRDDPGHVDQRMVGATPPATYELRPREKLFHGVRALRMLPVDGSSTLGRAGLLAHSYMLGPDGDSNGCVSIRDYERFLKAYDDGEIARLVVVPSLSAIQTAQRATSQS
jgi:type VI secretion system (T6SS) effector TldE1-like protein